MSMQTPNFYLTSNSNLNVEIYTFKFRQNKYLVLEYKSNMTYSLGTTPTNRFKTYRVGKPVHPRHEADHGGWRALPHGEGEAQRGARDDEVVVDGEDGVRREPPDGPEPVVEAVGVVDLEPHGRAAAPGAVEAEDAPAHGLRRRPRLAPHHVDGVDAPAGGVVRHRPPQQCRAPPRVDHHREAAAAATASVGNGTGQRG